MMHTYRWTGRRGGFTEITIERAHAAIADRDARECGWPGHSGGALRYAMADVAALARRLWCSAAGRGVRAMVRCGR